MNRLCSVCARGGSKGLVNKNLKLLLGKPLIIHTLEHARDAGIFAAIAVSSDSDDILNAADKFGVKHLVKRPDILASDEAPKIPAIRHCAQEVESISGMQFDTFVDLDCTSPLRIIEDIISAVDILETNSRSNIFSVTPARRSPYFDVVEIDNKGMVVPCRISQNTINRRQDTPPTFDLNASIYVWDRKTLMTSDSLYNALTDLYVMPNERSVEIDSELEFIYAELLMRKSLNVA